MVCPNCSAANPESLKFCHRCGHGLQVLDDAQTVLLDGSAAAAPARAKVPQVAAGLITPPPEATSQGAAGGPVSISFYTPTALAPGSSLGSRYRIERLLGEGGMGAVYEAHDQELNRTVALKVVRPELASSEQTMQRFKQELLLASKISHKNILRIHDLGDVNGIKFITMAFVKGSDLAGLMEREGRLPFERALKFTYQLCAALEAAHHEGVVHRDLKPQNILIDSADNIYVSDFGLAKSLEAAASMMTRTGQILGTPRYMSPEQVAATDVDSRSDLYSLGLILYEMFTGELPFRGDSAMQLMYQRVTERPADPRSVRPDLPDYIARVILKCLEKDPAKRYQSAREILNDLQSQNAPMISAAPGSQTISIVIPKPKASWWIAAAAAVVIGIGGVLAIPATRHWVMGSRSSATELGKPKYYVAVLPLNTAGDDTLKYVAEGVVDAVSAKLAGLRDVYVAPASAVNAAVSTQKDPAKVAKTLGVKVLVQGTLQSSGKRLSIVLAMDDVSKRLHPFNREFSGDRGDLLTLEDNIFSALVNEALSVRQSTEERARTAIRATSNVDAYDLYLKGRNLVRGKRDATSAQAALDLFQQATRIDSGFALAYAGMADASMILWDRTKDRKWVDGAVHAAEQAERLNSNLPEVHNSLGTAYTATGKKEEAISELKLALDKAPNSDETLRRLGKAYEAAGRRTQAIDAYTRAKELNPYLWRNFNELGAAWVRFGDNGKAAEVFQKATELQPDNPAAWANLGVVDYNQGKWADCITNLQHALTLQPNEPLYISNLGVATFFAGRYAESAALFAKAVQLKPKEAAFHSYLGDAYRWSGQHDQAAASYDQAISLALDNLAVNPENTEALGILAVSYAKKGDDANARKFIRQARGIKRDSEALMYNEATIHAIAGRMPEALASLRDALLHGHSLEEAKSDPELKALRATPQFSDMVREVTSPKPAK